MTRTAEQNEILGTFLDMLAGPTGDGAAKRGRGEKVSWKIDESHWDAAMRHIDRWWEGEREDKDSGVHPLIHAAWRFLAVAWHEDEEWGNHPPSPSGGVAPVIELEKFRLAREMKESIEARKYKPVHGGRIA